jgi:hypothetical protein
VSYAGGKSSQLLHFAKSGEMGRVGWVGRTLTNCR